MLFSRSVFSEFVTPWTASSQVSLSFTIPGTYSNSCPSSQWCHPTISSSAILFSCLQSFPASGSFSESALFIRWPKYWSLGSTSVLPVNIQDWFSLGLMSLQSKGLSRVFSNASVQKHQLFSIQPSLWSNSHPYMTTGKNIILTIQDLCWQSNVSAC